MLRGEIYWCNLEPVKGHEQGSVRPVVVVSADAYNETRSPMVAIVPLTRARSKNPLHVELAAEDTGLDGPSTALIDHTRFIDRTRLQGKPLGLALAHSLARIERNLSRAFGLVPSS
ncbi:MAG: type II toxin-antitoxin system PemK/MazF family toxin [Bryobacteraceae bacterium]